MRFQNDENLEIFQSTLPVWGATHPIFGEDLEVVISIHAPRVGSDAPRRWRGRFAGYFNPRSPCGERLCISSSTQPYLSFQSTLPVWGATLGYSSHLLVLLISIHAPRVGSDPDRREHQGARSISIHAPRVGSDEVDAHALRFVPISIHAPRVGSDRGLLAVPDSRLNFNPRSPCGERR